MYTKLSSKLLGQDLLAAGRRPQETGRTTELAQTTGTVLPQAALQQTTKLSPYGMLKQPTRHFFSDGDGLWGEHNPHFGKQKMGDSRW